MAGGDPKKPGWVTVVSILGIIMGCLGIFGGIQNASLPKILKVEKQWMPDIMSNNINSRTEGRLAKLDAQMARFGVTNTVKMPEDYTRMMNKILNYPTWYALFCYIAGAMGALIGGFYLFASIILLQRKKIGLNMFYVAASLSMVFVLARSIATTIASPIFGVTMIIGSAFSIIVNVVLLAVALGSDKIGFV